MPTASGHRPPGTTPARATRIGCICKGDYGWTMHYASSRHKHSVYMRYYDITVECNGTQCSYTIERYWKNAKVCAGKIFLANGFLVFHSRFMLFIWRTATMHPRWAQKSQNILSPHLQYLLKKNSRERNFLFHWLSVTDILGFTADSSQPMAALLQRSGLV